MTELCYCCTITVHVLISCYPGFRIWNARTDAVGAKLFDIGSKHLRKYLSTQAQDCQDASQHFHKDNVRSSI